GADYTVIVGERELEAGKVTLKDMASGEQSLLSIEEVIRKIRQVNKQYSNRNSKTTQYYPDITNAKKIADPW
ncbi:MAG: His/Gly/Thr/Pro-type tRNA ligase C-terminal domain-containing protein, partial [Methanosarcinaceae archaeon]